MAEIKSKKPKKALSKKQKRRNLIWLAATIPVVVLAIFLIKRSPNKYLTPLDGQIFCAKGQGVYLDQLQIKESSFGQKIDYIPMIVYRGRIYERSQIRDLASADITSLQGKKLAVTRNSIAGWDSQENGNDQVASTIGECDVYEVNGYDKRFRIMTVDEKAGTYSFYECLNGIWLLDGESLFEELNLKENMTAVSYRTLKEWNAGSKKYHKLEMNDEFAKFIDLLYEAPCVQFDDNVLSTLYDRDRYILTVSLNDKTNVEIILFEGGYVSYGSMNPYTAFQMNEVEFNRFYNKLSLTGNP